MNPNFQGNTLPNTGMNPMGMNPMGMNPMGMNPMGMNPMGMNPMGMNTMGANPMGMNPMGMNPNYPTGINVPPNYNSQINTLNYGMNYIPGMPQQSMDNRFSVNSSFYEQRPNVNAMNEVIRNEMNRQEIINLLIQEKEQATKTANLLNCALDEKYKTKKKKEFDNSKKLSRDGKDQVEIYVPRSDYFYSRDRQFLEELIMKSLKVSGAFGMKIVEDLDKKIYFQDDSTFNLQSLSEYDDKEEYFENYIKDGIYLDYIKKLIFSYNIQKEEQRAMRENKVGNFRKNGDIRMHNDIFNDIVTAPEDINPNFRGLFDTYCSNPYFTGRNSEEKFKKYKIRIYIDKIIFSYYKTFNREEILVNELKLLHRDFYALANQLTIPYLIEKIANIEEIEKEYENIAEPTEAEKKERENLQLFIIESKELLIEQKNKIKQKGNELYAKWKEIKKLREDQGYQSTKIKLNVLSFHNDQENNNILDYAFILSNDELTGEKSKETEKKRKSIIEKLECYIICYINKIKAFETQKVNISHPSFEAEFKQLFEIDVYTRPVTMECEIYINDQKAQVLELDPPGLFSKTVTSSAQLYEEIDFGPTKAMKIMEKDEKEENVNESEETPLMSKENKEEEKEEENKNLNEEEKKKIEEENGKKEKEKKEKEKEKKDKKKKEKEKKLKEKEKQLIKEGLLQDTKGRILLEAEYDGNDIDLPPIKIENKLELISIQKKFLELIKRHYDLEYPFDVNDPRNVGYLDEMKRKKRNYVLKLEYKEYLLNFFDVKSIRHYLLVKRLKKQSLKNFTFPILEFDIEQNEEIMKKYKELLEEDKTVDGKLIDETFTINEKLDNLENQQQYKDKIFLTNKDYREYIIKKSNILRKDVVHYENITTYAQIVSEVVCKNPLIIFKNFCKRIFVRARKLAPLPKEVEFTNLAKISKIGINIHVVKGFNIPIRDSSFQSNFIDHFKLQTIGLKNPLSQKININPNLNFSNFSNTQISNPNLSQMNQNVNMTNSMFNPFNNTGGLVDPYNVPYISADFFSNENNDQNQKIKILETLDKKVNSFIEVTYIYYDQTDTKRTDCVEGIHPDYNQHIEFTIYPKKKEGEINSEVSQKDRHFNMEELAKCPGTFIFSIYDQIKKEGVLENGNIKLQVFENKYLGSFSIPFVTVFQNASILDSICKVDIPKTVFGYYTDTTSIINVSEQSNEQKEEEQPKNPNKMDLIKTLPEQIDNSLNEIKKIVDPFTNTYVSLYITLEPVPNFVKNEASDYVPGSEDSIFLIKATTWLKNIKNSSLYKDRNIRLFAENIDGFSVFMPKYLKEDGEAPPIDVYNPDYAEVNSKGIEHVARYVSLIPFIEDNQTFTEDGKENYELPDCWCSDFEFLTLGFGDYEEHAVLLCNYFNYVDRKQYKDSDTRPRSYLVLGDAHPEGLTVYVMRITIDSKQVEFWNAKTGDCYYFDKNVEYNKCLCLTITQNFRDGYMGNGQICPLKSVGAIVTFDNVYVNKQSQSHPSLIEFDLSDKTKWMPFLTETSKLKYFPKGIQSIQTDDIIYKDSLDPTSNDNLEIKIKEYLKEQIIKESGNSPLFFTDVAEPIIKDVLSKYDTFCKDCTKSIISMTKDTNEHLIKSDKERKQEYEQHKLEIKNDRDVFKNDLFNYEMNIKNEFNGYKSIYGFPINISYTSFEQIYTQIKLTNAHKNFFETDNEISLTVYVSPMPMNVNSVWIFLAILKK